MHFIFLLLYFAEEYSIQKNKIHYNLRAHISVFAVRRHSTGTLERKARKRVLYDVGAPPCRTCRLALITDLCLPCSVD